MRLYAVLFSLIAALGLSFLAYRHIQSKKPETQNQLLSCTEVPAGGTIQFYGSIFLATGKITINEYRDSGQGYVHGGEDIRSVLVAQNLGQKISGSHDYDWKLDTKYWGCESYAVERPTTEGRGIITGKCSSKAYQNCIPDPISVTEVCNRGSCESQCTSQDSVIPIRPLPSAPSLGNGNYVDCFYTCRELKDSFSCSENSKLPWIEGDGDELTKGDQADVLIFEKGTFRAYADRSFTPRDREQLKSAFDIAFEQLGVLFLSNPRGSDFGKCTLVTKGMRYEPNEMADLWGANFFDKNTYGYANIWREPRQPYQRLIPGFPGIKYDVRVVKLWGDENLGLAVVGNQAVARPVIALNWNALKGYTKTSNSGEFLKRRDLAHPAEWARIIVHEILHTVGYSHPDRKTASKAEYDNTFMIAFSDCIKEVAMPAEIRLSESSLFVD